MLTAVLVLAGCAEDAIELATFEGVDQELELRSTGGEPDGQEPGGQAENACEYDVTYEAGSRTTGRPEHCTKTTESGSHRQRTRGAGGPMGAD